jgi:hypothetical protein
MYDFDFHKKDFDWQKFIGKPYHKYLPQKKSMAYSNFETLQEAILKLNLIKKDVSSIVEDFEKQTPSLLLTKILERNTTKALKIDTEKARSEMIISPILMELQELKKTSINFFSGIDFTVDTKRGLSGRCDFVISLDTEDRFLTAPVITIVEAKKDNMSGGLGQCIAEMVAAMVFNEKRKQNVKTIYGIVTTGIRWQFIKLEANTVYLEERERIYDIKENNIDELLGLLFKITETQN